MWPPSCAESTPGVALRPARSQDTAALSSQDGFHALCPLCCERRAGARPEGPLPADLWACGLGPAGPPRSAHGGAGCPPRLPSASERGCDRLAKLGPDPRPGSPSAGVGPQPGGDFWATQKFSVSWGNSGFLSSIHSLPTRSLCALLCWHQTGGWNHEFLFFFNGEWTDQISQAHGNNTIRGPGQQKDAAEDAAGPCPERAPFLKAYMRRPSCCPVPSAETAEPAAGSRSPEQPLRELGGQQPLRPSVSLSSDTPMGGQKPGPRLRQDDFTV